MAFFQREKTAPAETYAVQKSDAEWRAALSPEQFRVLRGHEIGRAHV